MTKPTKKSGRPADDSIPDDLEAYRRLVRNLREQLEAAEERIFTVQEQAHKWKSKAAERQEEVARLNHKIHGLRTRAKSDAFVLGKIIERADRETDELNRTYARLQQAHQERDRCFDLLDDFLKMAVIVRSLLWFTQPSDITSLIEIKVESNFRERLTVRSAYVPAEALPVLISSTVQALQDDVIEEQFKLATGAIE